VPDPGNGGGRAHRHESISESFVSKVSQEEEAAEQDGTSTTVDHSKFFASSNYLYHCRSVSI
ncbi:unnamed protein product, partial [Urochloa humidicola]